MVDVFMDPHIDFSKLFHQSSKDHGKGHPPIPSRYEDWPEEWRTTFYKAYPRLPKLDLEGTPPHADFFDLVQKRQSRRDFTRQPLTKRELSVLLKYSCGTTGKLVGERLRRAHPSGGGRFPIETYPIVFREGGDLPAGVYHYNVKHHQLDVLWQRPFADGEVDELFSYPWVKEGSVALVMTAVFWRSQNKYGERGYRYILLEAGHIGQSLSLAAEALDLKCCALGGTRDERLEELLDVDGAVESVIYALVLGR